MNTMYAAVSRRAREIGTLRALGFSRSHILVSFLIESLLLSLAGGLLGLLLALPLYHLSAGVGNMTTSLRWTRVAPESEASRANLVTVRRMKY